MSSKVIVTSVVVLLAFLAISEGKIIFCYSVIECSITELFIKLLSIQCCI